MTLKVLGFAGSLRQKSYNRAALRAAAELAPEEMEVEILNLDAIPVYNEDVREKGYPPPVQEFRDRIRAADALLIAVPEYNYSMSGVLKNAIDWASRPPDQPLQGKPVAIMGASQGRLGAVRAQYHLRQSCVFVNMHPVNKPEVMITHAAEKFDSNGKLTDEDTRAMIRSLLESLQQWADQLA